MHIHAILTKCQQLGLYWLHAGYPQIFWPYQSPISWGSCLHPTKCCLPLDHDELFLALNLDGDKGVLLQSLQ